MAGKPSNFCWVLAVLLTTVTMLSVCLAAHRHRPTCRGTSESACAAPGGGAAAEGVDPGVEQFSPTSVLNAAWTLMILRGRGSSSKYPTADLAQGWGNNAKSSPLQLGKVEKGTVVEKEWGVVRGSSFPDTVQPLINSSAGGVRDRWLPEGRRWGRPVICEGDEEVPTSS